MGKSDVVALGVKHLKIIVACASPLLLGSLEHEVRRRIGSSLTELQFVGPSLASAGFGMLISRLIGTVGLLPAGRPGSESYVISQGGELVFQNATLLNLPVGILALGMLALWVCSLHTSLDPAVRLVPLMWFTISFWLGFGTYLMSAAASFLHAEFAS